MSFIQGLGAMRGKLNLDFEISNGQYQRHRALYLHHPTTDMTGDYMCQVSTLQNEVSAVKKMVVYGEKEERNKGGGEDKGMGGAAKVIEASYQLAASSLRTFNQID